MSLVPNRGLLGVISIAAATTLESNAVGKVWPFLHRRLAYVLFCTGIVSVLAGVAPASAQVSPESLDCRNASHQCASGFVCDQQSNGSWECLPEPESTENNSPSPSNDDRVYRMYRCTVVVECQIRIPNSSDCFASDYICAPNAAQARGLALSRNPDGFFRDAGCEEIEYELDICDECALNRDRIDCERLFSGPSNAGESIVIPDRRR